MSSKQQPGPGEKINLYQIGCKVVFTSVICIRLYGMRFILNTHPTPPRGVFNVSFKMMVCLLYPNLQIIFEGKATSHRLRIWYDSQKTNGGIVWPMTRDNEKVLAIQHDYCLKDDMLPFLLILYSYSLIVTLQELGRNSLWFCKGQVQKYLCQTRTTGIVDVVYVNIVIVTWSVGWVWRDGRTGKGWDSCQQTRVKSRWEFATTSKRAGSQSK
jgi:hypothetical protein